MEDHRWVKGFENVTTLSAPSAVVLVVGVLAILIVPRRYVFLPLFLVCSFVPVSERVVIFGMDFAFLRLMALAGWARLAIRGELKPIEWSRIDSVFSAWILWRIAANVLRTASFGVLVRHLGLGFDALGIYFLARMVIRNWRDLDGVIVSFAVVAIPVSISMTYEQLTGWNFASVFSDRLVGGVMSRDGAIRALCGYAHPLVAGAVWASMLPVMCARWWKPGANRLFVVVSIAAASTCVLASSSSTPLLGTLIAIVAAGCWVFRRNMSWVRFAILGLLIFLELVMEKPIWHLFQRVTVIGLDASTGYHRYRLFDAFVRTFSDWALLGLNSTAYWGRQLDDITNTFIAQAVSGGFIALVLLIALFVLLFQRNGRLLRAYRGQRVKQIYLWSFGVCLVAHTAMMNAMPYIWQMQIPWYVCFAMIAGVPQPQIASAARRARVGKRTMRQAVAANPIPGSRSAAPALAGAKPFPTQRTSS